jgi:hypothetical protein
MSIARPSASLIMTCNKGAYFSQGCCWSIIRNNFNSVLQVMNCSWYHSLNHPTGKSRVVLSQEIGVDTPYFPLRRIYLLTLQNAMNTGFRDNSLATALPCWLVGDCVKTCNAVSTLPLSVELRVLQSVSCPHFALFHQPQLTTQSWNCYIRCWCSRFISPASLHLILVLLS